MNQDSQHRPDIRYLKALMGVVKPESLNPLELAAITWAMESALDRVVVDDDQADAEPVELEGAQS